MNRIQTHSDGTIPDKLYSFRVMSNIPGAARTYRYIIAMVQDHIFTEFITKYGSSKRKQIGKVPRLLTISNNEGNDRLYETV